MKSLLTPLSASVHRIPTKNAVRQPTSTQRRANILSSAATNAMRALLLAGASFLPQTAQAHNSPEDIIVERVERIEHNTVLNDDGTVKLIQLIFSEWSDQENRYRIIASRTIPSEADWNPRYNHINKEHEVQFWEGDIQRKIKGQAIWTSGYIDPDQEDRIEFCGEERRELIHPLTSEQKKKILKFKQ